MTPAEQGAFSKDGNLTKEGIERVDAALLAAAYGDPELLSVMLESTDDNVRAFTKAMRDAAGSFVTLKADIEAGLVPAKFDISADLAATVRLIADLRRRSVSPKEYLAQTDAFATPRPITEALLRAFYNEDLSRALSQQKITEVLTDYAEEAGKQRAEGLLPGEATPEGIVTQQRARRTREERQGDLLAGSTARQELEEDRVQAQRPEDEGGGAEAVAGGTKLRQVRVPAEDGSADMLKSRFPLQHKSRRDSVKTALKMGKAVSLARPAKELLDLLKAQPAMLPDSVRESVVEKIEPYGDHFKITARDTKGDTLEFYDTYEGVSGTVGLFSVLPDGTPYLAFFSFEPGGSLSDRLKGGRAHEGVHALREIGLLPGSASEPASPWGRLLGHANLLGVMSQSVREFAMKLGHPDAVNWSNTITLGESYKELYKNYPRREEALDQEAVAHMVQLYVHGQLSEQEAAPVKDLLDSILSGETARGTPVLEAANPRMQEFVEALEGRRSFLPEGETLRAIGDSERAMRRMITARLRAGQSIAIAEEVTEAVLDAVQPHLDMVPIGTHVAAVTRLEPRIPTRRNPADVRVHYRTADGYDAHFEITLAQIGGSRAITSPDGELILVLRFSRPPSQQVGPSVGGVADEGWVGAGGQVERLGRRGDSWSLGMAGLIAHEAVHAARIGQTIRTSFWRRLLEHANVLQILDMELRTYLERIGDPTYQNAAPGKTIRSAYLDAYAEASDLKEYLDQESVAVMTELAVNGSLTAYQLGMVAEDIRTALGGERRFAASDRQGGPLYALAPEVSDRELDQFGLYSSSLEAAKRIPQEKGTVEQMRAMLLTAGAAPKELEAVGFDKAFPDPQAKVSKGEIEAFLRDNRVTLGSKVKTSSLSPQEEAEVAELSAHGEWRRVEEIRREAGGAKFETYSTPGGIPGSYREVVVTLPITKTDVVENLRERLARREITQEQFDAKVASQASDYTSSHWPGIANPLLHYRVKDFAAVNGKTRVLDELQSDWAQRARDQGTRDPARIEELKRQIAEQADKRDGMASLMARTAEELAPGSTDTTDALVILRQLERSHPNTPQGKRAAGLLGDLRQVENNHMDLMSKLAAAERETPSAPFISNTSDWVDLGLKQALVDAARDPAVTRFAWAPGKVQADRYHLSHVADEIRYHPDSETLDLLRGGKLEHSRTVRQGDLPDYIGKEMAEQLMATEPVKARDGRPWHKLKNIADIKIGGEGMKSFYGDFTKEGSYTPGIVGTRLLKLVRQLDPEAARIEPTELQIRDRSAPYNAKEGEPTRDYPSIPITPKLREKLLQGLPMFGAEKVRTLGSVIPQGKARADLQEGMQDAVNAALGIVARIAGRGVRVELRDIIPTAEVLSERQMAEVEGVVGRVSPTAGGFYRPSTLNADALIGLATNDPAFDLNTAAGHEAWHHVKEALATPAEKRLLNLSAERARMRRLAAAELGMGIDDARLEKLDPREIEAYAFQRYRRLAEEEAGSASGLHIAIRKLFDRIIQVLRAVRNAMNGLGYQTYEDVFERARTGEIAQREDREYFVSGEASEQVGSSRLLTSTPAETGREIAPVVLEGELLPSFAEQLAAAQKSQYWPESWFSETSRGIYPPHLKTESNLADAVRHVQEMEASNAWHALVFPDGIRRVGEERHVAEARAYRENPQLWESYRNAKIAFLEGRKGRPLTEGELMWESLDRPPTSPEATASELMDTYGREKFMVAGHPDLARRHEERLRHAEQKRLSAPSQQVLSGEGTQAAISSEGLPETDPSLLASVIPRGVINAQSGGTLGRRASAMLRRADPLRVKIQDKMLPVRRVIEAQRAAGIDVPIAMDTYVAEAIFHGRAGERMENLQRDYIEPLTEGMRLSNVSLEQLDEYLYARHAPERNAAIAQIDPINLEGSGMAGAEAQAIMDRVATSGKQGEYDALARIIDDMITDALNTRVAAGLMTSEDRDAWRAKYSSYVPLRGFEASDESTDPDRPRSGQGMQVRGPESKRALGRSSKADSPVSYAVLQAMEAIVRSEKNRVFKTLYRNVEANPDPMWNIYKGESVKRFNPSTGLVERKWRAPQTFMGSDNDLLSGKIGGKTVYLEIKHRGLLRAMKGVGAETQGPIVNAMMRVMRIYAQLLTSWNPEFTIPNFFRDMQTALGNISDVADKPVNIRRQILKDAYSAKSIRGILSALRGGGQHEYASWFEEYRLAGGKISFMEYNDVQRIKKRIVASLNDGDTTRAMKSAFTLIEDINTAVENGVRLSSYIALRKAGIAKDRAAFIARELTVNFNRKGEWGAAINSMYLFFNASAQGSVRLAQAVYRSKALRYALGGLFVSAMVLDWWNALLAGDDDDGENYYDQIPDWIKERNIVIVTGSKKEDYVTIPLAYGYNVPYLAGQQLGSVLRGKKEPLAAAANVASGAMESFNPLGSAVSFWQYVSPTILDPGVQMLENKTWYGGPIYPTKFDKRQPDSELYWNTTPWYWKESARILNAGTGGNVGRPGYVDVSPETIQHYVEFVSGGLGKFAANAIQTGQQLFSGEEWIPEKTPLMRRFYGKATTVSKRRQFYEAWDEVDAAVYEINKLKKNDQREEAKQAMSRYPAQVKVHGLFKGTQKTLKNLRDQRDKITANERMSQPDKRLRIEAIIERENVIVQKALDAYHEAVREQAKKKPVPFPEPMRVGLRDLAQAEPTPQEKLRERGYTDSFPPLVSEQGVWGQKQEEAIRLYMKPRIDALTAIGVPPDEAFAEIRAMPDVVTEVQRLGREGAADPHLREKERKLLEDLR